VVLSTVHWTGTAKHLILGIRLWPSARFAVDHPACTLSEAAPPAPTAEHRRRPLPMAGYRAGKQDRQFIGVLVEHFRQFMSRPSSAASGCVRIPSR
jgi:hypothetical protein